MISFVAVFCFVMAVYETLEYVFCYDDEKREQERETLTAGTTPKCDVNTSADDVQLFCDSQWQYRDCMWYWLQLVSSTELFNNVRFGFGNFRIELGYFRFG